MTLLEVTLAVTVLAVMAAAMLPVLYGSAEQYRAAAEGRLAIADGSYALERLTGLVREIPIREDGTLAVASARTDSLTLDDGSGVVVRDGVLLLVASDASEAVLCRDVESLVIRWRDAAGTTIPASPDDADLFEFGIRTRGGELRGAAFPRVRQITS